MNCQINILPDAGKNLSFKELIILRVQKKIKYIQQTIKKIFIDPHIIIRKSKSLLGIKDVSFPKKPKANQEYPVGSHILSLRPGEVVRVKPLSEIEITLDEKGRYDGLAYMKTAMDKYCGGTYIVKKCVNLFFDERRQKLLKVRDVVILDGVYCETPKSSLQEWAGCDRTCFLFWKEAWLERVGSEKNGSDRAK